MEIENLKQQVNVAQRSFGSAIEIADYETAHILAELLQLLTRHILLCQKQQIEEAAND